MRNETYIFKLIRKRTEKWDKDENKRRKEERIKEEKQRQKKQMLGRKAKERIC